MLKEKYSKELKSFVAKYYAYNLFSIMGFIIPFVAIMFDENGLSATQIAIVMMTSKIVQLIFEIPSGVLADRYSRKYVLLVSRFINGIPWILWALFPSFWGYLAGYVFFGINASLDSGCAEAFVYDELSKYKRRDLFERVQGRSGALVSVGVIIACLGAYALTKYGYGYNTLLFLSFVTTVISAFILWTIKPAKAVEKSEEPESVSSYFEILREGVKYAFNQKFLLKMILFLAFTNVINAGTMEYQEIFLNEITNDLAKVAILFGIIEGAYSIGNFFAEYLKKIKLKFLLLIYPALAALDIVCFWLYSYPVSMILSFISIVSICSIFVNVLARANDLIPSKIRATTLSVKGFLESIGTFVSLLCFGMVVDYFDSYRMGFLIFAELYFIGCVCFVLWFFLGRDEKALGA